MTTEDAKRKAVDKLARKIKENSRGKINSEQAHRMAVETAQRRERKQQK